MLITAPVAPEQDDGEGEEHVSGPSDQLADNSTVIRGHHSEDDADRCCQEDRGPGEEEGGAQSLCEARQY
jgi:hypothetical protein